MSRQTQERAVIRGLIRHMKAAGFPVCYVNNGEERVPVRTEDEALEHVFSVDESHLVFGDETEAKRVSGDVKGTRYSVYVVLGNAPDGSEVCADWSDVSPFGEAIDAYLSKERGFY